MRKSNLTAAVLKSLLSYDEATGEFRWLAGVCNVPAGAVAGSRGKRGYIDICVAKERHGAHRLAWLYVYGKWPDADIDHKNGDRSDNRIANLRDVPHSVNAQNIRAAHRRNRATGLLGVRRADSKAVRFNASIMTAGEVKHLGTFDEPEAAHAAYLAAKRRLHEGCTL